MYSSFLEIYSYRNSYIFMYRQLETKEKVISDLILIYLSHTGMLLAFQAVSYPDSILVTSHGLSIGPGFASQDSG